MAPHGHSVGPSIIIVPTTDSYDSNENTYSGRGGDGAKKRRPKFDPIASGNFSSSRNYLLGGGGRSQDKEREEALGILSRAALKDLKTANAALANELTSSQTRANEEMRSLREEVSSLQSSLYVEKQRLASAEAAVDAEKQTRRLAEERHALQLKEAERRLETERNKRADAEAELRQVVKKAVAYRQKVADAETRVSALSEVHADLEAERALRDDLQARVNAQEQARDCLEQQVGPLSAVGTRLAQAESAAAAASERGRKLEEKLRRYQETQATLQETLIAAQSERQTLDKRVRELEQVAAANVGLEADVEKLRTELEAARRHVSELQRRADAAEEERRQGVSRLADVQHTLKGREEQLAAVTAEAAVARAEADTNLARLRSELEATRESLRAAEKQVRTLKEASEEQGQRGNTLAVRLQEATSRVEDLTRQRNDMAGAAAARDQKLEEAQTEQARMRRLLAAAEEEAASWRLRSSQDQALADLRDSELRKKTAAVEELQQSLQAAVERLATAQQAAAAARRSSDERIHALEARLQQCNIDVRELKDALSIAEHARSGLTAELARARDDAAHAQASLAEEQARCSKGRAELAAIVGSQKKEADGRQRMVSELLVAVQAEEAARLEAEREANRLRHDKMELEGRLAACHDAKEQVQEALMGTEASLGTVQRQAQTYRRENRALLSNYDSWLNSLVGQRSPLGFQPAPRAHALGFPPTAVPVD